MVAPNQNQGTGFNPLDAGTELLGGLLTGVGGFLGGPAGSVLGTGLGIDALNEMRGLGKEAQAEALRIGERAQADTAFKPFSISTGFGGVQSWSSRRLYYYSISRATGFTRPVSRHNRRFNGWFWCGAPDVSGIQGQALGGIQGLLQQAQGGIAGREQDIYDRIRATQMPEEQRQQLALDQQLASQGRTGLRTAQFGGSPEQFAMEKARAEAMNQASLASINQAEARESRFSSATGMFGLRVSRLPSYLVVYSKDS